MPMNMNNNEGESTSSKPYWIRQRDVAKKLSMSVDTLRKLVKSDPTFARPIKRGKTRQAPVYYSLPEIEAWVLSNKTL